MSHQEKIQIFLNEARLLTKIENVRKQADPTRDFNIFKLLDRTTDEVKCHSRVIGELLNPKGSHGLGSLFLDRFIDRLRIKHKLSLEKDSHAIVSVEHPAPINNTNGRIDLLIETKEAFIVIENKVYAEDQPKQLERYLDYIDKLNNKSKKVKIVYLTLDGSSPSEDSLGRLEQDRVYCISYKYFILNFIDDCIKEATSYPIIRETLTQYKKLVQLLTGEDHNMKDLESIVSLFKGPEDLQAAFLLKDAAEKKRAEIEASFWQELKASLLEKTAIENIFFNEEYSGVESENAIINSSGYYGPWLVLLEKDGIQICFNPNKEQGVLLHGIRFLHKVNDKVQIITSDQNAELHKNASELLGSFFKKPYYGRWWGVYEVPEAFKEINFHHINEHFFQLADDNLRSQMIDSYTSEVANLLEEIYPTLKKLI